MRRGLAGGTGLGRLACAPRWARFVRARRRGPLGLLPVLAELLQEGELLLVSPIGLLNVIVAEDDATVGRPIADRRRTVRGRRLLLGRHLVEPDPAHARRRPIRLRHVVPALLGAGDAGE